MIHRPLTVVIVGLAVMLTGIVQAQPGDPGDNAVGLFFSDTSFTDADQNLLTFGAPFTIYYVLLNATVDAVDAYELALTYESEDLHALDTTGPAGWTNAGDLTNHLVTFTTPLPVDPTDGLAVLAESLLLLIHPTEVWLYLGPATPSSIVDQPSITRDGTTLPCSVIVSPYFGDASAALNGTGSPVEATTLTQLRALFR